MSGLYIHVPFCNNKCLYCDFYTGGSRIANWQTYIDCLINELHFRKEELQNVPETLYIGGGTPSLMPDNEFKRLIYSIREIYDVKYWKEFTIEVNPEDVTESKVKIWKNSGVNRVSIGVQSFSDSELILIGRKHDSKTAEDSIKILQSEFDNVSVDLMFGLPNQTLESYATSVEKLLNLGPQHISSYSLMLEPGTAMTLLHSQGGFELPNEDLWIKLLDYTENTFSKNGYGRYEISNYALRGFESIHNISYWTGKPYLGLGPSAHSYDGFAKRRGNRNDIKGYIKYFSSKKGCFSHKFPFYIEEQLSRDELKEEMIMTRLRMTQGLNINEFAKRFGETEKNNLLKKASHYLKEGFLKEVDNFIRMSSNGFKISDSIISSII